MKRHPNCKLSIAKEQDLIAYYQAGGSLSGTGTAFGLSLTGVQKILKYYTISRRSVSAAQTGVYYNNPEKFFDSLVPAGDCLLWQGATASGYGVTCFEGVKVATHRLSYTFTHGPIAAGLQILHKCDTPLCCNPEHLFVGTHQDNMQDRNEKGRCVGGSNKGEANARSRFTSVNILKIRAMAKDGYKQKEIAKVFSTTQPVISRIVARKDWNHI